MVTDDDIGTHENPGLGQDHLGEVLVHAVGTCRDAAPDIAHAGHLQQTLDGSVLSERTMKYWEDHLDVMPTPETSNRSRSIAATTFAADRQEIECSELIPPKMTATWVRFM